MRKYIWLFGENGGKTRNNNSFYFWKHTVFKDENILKYFILNYNKSNLDFYKSLDKKYQDFIVWRNTLKHWMLYDKADMLFVSLSYLDVTPSRFYVKKLKRIVHAPLIYLQHGTLAIKKLGYTGRSYNNNIFRFCIYNKKMLDVFSKENNFEPYQLYYAKYHPRYIEMIRRWDEYNKNKHDKKVILYFLTWREYLKDNTSNSKLINDLIKIVNNKVLIKYLKDNNYIFKFCVHQFFDSNVLQEVINTMDKDVFKIEYPGKVDVMDELVSCDILITDYSSVGFECTIMNKPVILFTPDLKKYLRGRSIYCNIDELSNYSVSNVRDLVSSIVNKKYGVNNFFKSRLPKNIDYDYIRNGKHIDDMNDYFKSKCEEKISFVGYKFGGRGGSVSASKSLVYGLMKEGYLVEMISLKGTLKDRSLFPCGVNEVKLSDKNNTKYNRAYEKINNKFRLVNKLYYFNNDSSSKYMTINLGERLKNKLDNINSNTVVSTRESIHPFLYDTKNDNIKNKIYFFHTDASLVNNIFPGLYKDLENIKYSKCAFVTKSNYEKWNKIYSLDINKYSLVGNCIDEEKTISVKKIKTVNKKKFTGICLTRLSKDRMSTIKNIVNFGIYLRDNNINNIVIDVYGMGDYLDKLKGLIRKNKIKKYINYIGVSDEAEIEIRKRDFLVDFSDYQSFGMIYLEGILNGKMVFCKRNDGAKEVLDGIDAFYDNYDELKDKILNLNNISKEELINNYNIISRKYSQKSITHKFLELVKDKNDE